MIPKKISFFWGNPVMSWLRYMTLSSFRQFHPDWEMELFVNRTNKHYGDPKWVTQHRQDFFNYDGDNYLDKVGGLDVKVTKWGDPNARDVSPSQKSNFFKWKILTERKGFYSDMDILYFKPIDDIRETMNEGEYTVGITHNGRFYSIGFMASDKGVAFKGIYKHCVKVFESKKSHYQGAGVQAIYDKWPQKETPQVMEREFQRYDKFYYIPMEDFYLVNRLEGIFNVDVSRELFKGGRALHWYAGGKLAQDYNNTVSPVNFKSKSNTISRVLQFIEQ